MDEAMRTKAAASSSVSDQTRCKNVHNPGGKDAEGLPVAVRELKENHYRTGKFLPSFCDLPHFGIERNKSGAHTNFNYIENCDRDDGSYQNIYSAGNAIEPGHQHFPEKSQDFIAS